MSPNLQAEFGWKIREKSELLGFDFHPKQLTFLLLNSQPLQLLKLEFILEGLNL